MPNQKTGWGGRGFTMLELVVATAISAIVVLLALQALITFDRGQAMRMKVTDLQGGARLALDWLESDLRHASLGAGSGIVWTSSGGNRVPRPAVQIFSNLPAASGVIGDAKQGTDAVLLVEHVASSAAVAATAADLSTSAGSIALTTAQGFNVGNRVLVGDYAGDAMWGIVATLPAGTTTMTLQDTVNVLPGQPVPVLGRGAVVRPARARLYYVDTSDELVRVELAVPRAPLTAAEVMGREVLAQGFENMKVGCQLDDGVGGFSACPSSATADATLVGEAQSAFGSFASADGPLLTADGRSVSNLRNVTIQVVVRSRTPLRDQQGDPRVALTGASGSAVTLGDATNPYVRRAYRLSAAVRNTSLGAL